ncbi:MAG: HNH endonuclease, partial [Propionibacteriaceae bacterium]|nr:HNH endonuclease [Propionibacteriaceae bacterium]
MYESQEEWLSHARAEMTKLTQLCRQRDELEAEISTQLATAIHTYTWPEEIPLPKEHHEYRFQEISEDLFGEDLSGELAVTMRMSTTAAAYLIKDIRTLCVYLPTCWTQVTTGVAPLWQARRVAHETQWLTDDQYAIVDAMIAPTLGTVNTKRLNRVISAALATADPNHLRDQVKHGSSRHVHVNGDTMDPLTGWVNARIDRSDSIYFDAMIQHIADTLAANGNTATHDERRAKALGILANPAAAVQLIGLPTTRGMNPAPDTEDAQQAFIRSAATLIPAFTPRTQVYVHLHADNLNDPEAIARIENIGPLLIEQLHNLTQATHVRLTPAIHLNASDISVDSYEIPTRIRDRILLTHPHDVFPWSSIESRHLDLDHTNPYRAGETGQTRVSNLGPLSRRAHRLKTHAGW